MGPLNSTDIHAMMDERRNMELRIKMAAIRHVTMITAMGILAILAAFGIIVPQLAFSNLALLSWSCYLCNTKAVPIIKLQV